MDRKHLRLRHAAIITCVTCGAAWVAAHHSCAQQFEPALAAEILSVSDGQMPLTESLVTRLRSYGYASLDRLSAMLELLEERREAATGIAARAQITMRIEALKQLVDRVSGQRWASRSTAPLFWHSDWTAAQQDAQQQRKPVLALFIAGDLAAASDGLTALLAAAVYSDQEVARLLRDHFVLYWETDVTATIWPFSMPDEAPSLPVIHIGTTATGCPLDALIGAPCPSAFGPWLQQLKAIDSQVAQIEPARVDAIDQAIARRHSRADKTLPVGKTICELSFKTTILMGDEDVARALAVLPELSTFESLSPEQRARRVEALLAKANRDDHRALVQECFADLASCRELHLMHAKIRIRWHDRPSDRWGESTK